MPAKSWGALAMNIGMGDLGNLSAAMEVAQRELTRIERGERRQHLEAAARAQAERQARREQRRAFALERGVPEIPAIENGPSDLTGGW